MQSESEPFERWAVYYDLIHIGIPGDVDFYVNQAFERGGEVLEIGVGTGRIAVPLALAGVDVTGLDNSAAMLTLCRHKMDIADAFTPQTMGKWNLIQADMRDFRIRKKFPIIIMPYRAFMHLLTPADQRQCLDCVRSHLAPDGVFIMDTWLPCRASLEEMAVGPHSKGLTLCGKHRLREEKIMVWHYRSSKIDEMNQLMIEEHLIRETSPSGKKIYGVTTLPMVRSWTTRREMEYLFELAGLDVAGTYGDFKLGPVTPTTFEIVWTLRKAAKRNRNLTNP